MIGTMADLLPAWTDGRQSFRDHVDGLAGPDRKLEDNPHRPRHLLTEPGMGYRYQPEARPVLA
jgi:hypothetical protein